MMRILFFAALLALIGTAVGSCKSSSTPPTFCDTSCLKDSIRFSSGDSARATNVYISARNCMADTIAWTHSGMGSYRKLGLADLVGADVRLNKNFVRCVINDTSYAWVLFNDCSNGRGYALKIPFDKKKSITPNNRAINGLDPKFSVAEGLVAFTDPGNIFVEDMLTGKKDMMTFGQAISPDYNAIHQTFDSVNITPTRIWVKFRIGDEWKEKEKKIELK